MNLRIILAAFALSATATITYAASTQPPNPNPVSSPKAAIGDRGMAIMSAAIKGTDGSIYRGEGVEDATTTRFSAGSYEVGFGRDITECTYFVTAGEAGIGSAVPFAVGVTRRFGNPNGVFIQTRTPNTNTNTDTDFFVLVYCGR